MNYPEGKCLGKVSTKRYIKTQTYFAENLLSFPQMQVEEQTSLQSKPSSF
jgi:hypothetical protein